MPHTFQTKSVVVKGTDEGFRFRATLEAEVKRRTKIVCGIFTGEVDHVFNTLLFFFRVQGKFEFTSGNRRIANLRTTWYDHVVILLVQVPRREVVIEKCIQGFLFARGANIYVYLSRLAYGFTRAGDVRLMADSALVKLTALQQLFT